MYIVRKCPTHFACGACLRTTLLLQTRSDYDQHTMDRALCAERFLRRAFKLGAGGVLVAIYECLLVEMVPCISHVLTTAQLKTTECSGDEQYPIVVEPPEIFLAASAASASSRGNP